MNPAPNAISMAGRVGRAQFKGLISTPAGHSLPNADTMRFFITSWDAQHDGDTASTQEGEQPALSYQQLTGPRPSLVLGGAGDHDRRFKGSNTPRAS